MNPKRSHMKYIFCVLISIALVSCTVEIKQPAPTASSTSAIVATRTISTATVTIAATSTPTAEPTLRSYSFPAWMKNPSTTILAAFIKDDVNKAYSITFYNAASGENYQLMMPENAKAYFWYDNAHFGFLADDLKSLELIDLNTGETSVAILPPESLQFVNLEQINNSTPDRKFLRVSAIPDHLGNGIILTYGWNWGRKFIAHWGKELLTTQRSVENRVTLIIADSRTEQEAWKFMLPKGFAGTELAWSPRDKNRLAYIQGKHIPNNDIEMDSMQLIIVDAVTQKTLWTYDGDFGGMRWSPDGKKILYLNNASRFSRARGVPFQDAPCILFVETGLKRCLRSIPRHVPDGFKLMTTGFYQWGEDSESIFFVYEYYQPGSSKWYEPTANLCIYSLVDGHINCPTENLDVLDGRGIALYSTSPGDQYSYLCYSEDASQLSHGVAQMYENGLIRNDGTGFFSWPGTKQDWGPVFCSEDVLWRPLP